MNIIKCSDFIYAKKSTNELEYYLESFTPKLELIKEEKDDRKAIGIRTLDCLIDNNGKLYLIKGNLEMKDAKTISSIIGPYITYPNGESTNKYPAGLDKNGFLVAISTLNNKALSLSEPKTELIRVIDRDNQEPWELNKSYKELLPLTPTGWVNFKLNSEIALSVRRYSKNLLDVNITDNNEFFLAKLKELCRVSNPNNSIGARTTATIQKKLSSIMLLHQLNELRNFFTPSSGGFIFESIICGLMKKEAIVVDDNGAVDVRCGGDTYQIKLIDSVSKEIILYKPGAKYVACKYYVIAIKYATHIDIYNFTSNPNDVNYYGREEGGNRLFSTRVNALNTSKIVSNGESFKIRLDLYDLDDRISKISSELKKSLDKLYSYLSQFHYNVETITTGVDKDGDLVGTRINDFSNGAIGNLSDLSDELNKLLTHMKL